MKNKFGLGLSIFVGLWLMVISYKAKQMKTVLPDKVQVTATFYPLAEFTRKVGDDKVNVETIVPPGTEPHDYEPNIKQIAQIYQSQLFVYNGAGLDMWADKVAGEKGTGINIKAVEKGTDPHTWLDPIMAAETVGKIGQALEKADTKNAQDYKTATKKYQDELFWLDKQFKLALSDCIRKEIITSHQAFYYLAKRYGLKVYAISGVSPEEEPTPGKIAVIATLVKKTGIKYIFFETLTSPKIAQTIAKETGAKTLVFNPLEGLTEEQSLKGEDYISVQQMNLNNLKIALECH